MVEDLSVAVHLTLTPEIQAHANNILERLAGMGVCRVSLSASDTALAQALTAVREVAAVLQMDLVWNLPVPYSKLHPVAVESGAALIEGAGRAWLYVEPDGDVRPAQGDPKILGNLLREPWENIWGKG